MIHKLKTTLTVLALILAAAVGYVAWGSFRTSSTVAALDLYEVANGDAQFWLMQGGQSNRYLTCTVHYQFDQPLDEALVLERLKELVAPYEMFKRNVVEVNDLPYWQRAQPDWQQNFRRLSNSEDIHAIRSAVDAELSMPQEPGEGLPLFRAYLSSDGQQLTFIWHHVISDYEGIFNKHARHLFHLDVERTRFGYQFVRQSPSRQTDAPTSYAGRRNFKLAFEDRSTGFEGTGFEVQRFTLPITDQELFALGQSASLPMSDIFSFITMRTVSRYHETTGTGIDGTARPVVSPLSLRKSSLTFDEGNNRAIKRFPLIFPMESLEEMYQRVLSLAPASSSYDRAGKAMKFTRRFSFLEAPLRKMASPDYISNYFPLADGSLNIEGTKLLRQDLRVPMVPYERVKFAWSNYNGEVALFMHIDTSLIDSQEMIAAFKKSSAEILAFLRERAGAGTT
jgi:hypothetical protein